MQRRGSNTSQHKWCMHEAHTFRDGPFSRALSVWPCRLCTDVVCLWNRMFKFRFVPLNVTMVLISTTTHKWIRKLLAPVFDFAITLLGISLFKRHRLVEYLNSGKTVVGTYRTTRQRMFSVHRVKCYVMLLDCWLVVRKHSGGGMTGAIGNGATRKTFDIYCATTHHEIDPRKTSKLSNTLRVIGAVLEAFPAKRIGLPSGSSSFLYDWHTIGNVMPMVALGNLLTLNTHLGKVSMR